MEDNSIDVTTADDLSGNEDSFDMEEQIDQAIGILEEAKEDSDSVFACGLILAYTPDTDVQDPNGETAEGRVWRVINPKAHDDYENVLGIVEDAEAFDSMIDQLEIKSDVREAKGMDEPNLGDILGGL